MLTIEDLTYIYNKLQYVKKEKEEIKEDLKVFVTDQDKPDGLYSKARKIIDEKFYNLYPPVRYERQFDLYNTFLFTTDKYGSLYDKYGSKYMKKEHRADHALIYRIAFTQGWHGGAKKKSKAKDSTRYYRYPHPFYTQWGDVAKRSEGITQAWFKEQIESYYIEESERLYKPLYDVMYEIIDFLKIRISKK